MPSQDPRLFVAGRERAGQGYSGSLLVPLSSELAIGPPIYQPTTRWDLTMKMGCNNPGTPAERKAARWMGRISPGSGSGRGHLHRGRTGLGKRGPSSGPGSAPVRSEAEKVWAG